MSTDGLLARVDALELIFKEDDFGSRLREAELKIAALEEKGAIVHTKRLDGHDRAITLVDEKAELALRQNEEWRKALINDREEFNEKMAALKQDVTDQLKLSRASKEGADKLYALLERVLDSQRLVAECLRLPPP